MIWPRSQLLLMKVCTRKSTLINFATGEQEIEFSKVTKALTTEILKCIAVKTKNLGARHVIDNAIVIAFKASVQNYLTYTISVTQQYETIHGNPTPDTITSEYAKTPPVVRKPRIV